MRKATTASLLVAACSTAHAIDLNHTVTMQGSMNQLTPVHTIRLKCAEIMAPLVFDKTVGLETAMTGLELAIDACKNAVIGGIPLANPSVKTKEEYEREGWKIEKVEKP